MLTLRSAIKMKKLFGILVILLAGLMLVQTVSATVPSITDYTYGIDDWMHEDVDGETIDYLSPNGETTEEFRNTITMDIEFDISSKYWIDIQNTDGEYVRSLASGLTATDPKEKTWDGKDDEGEFVADGLYAFVIYAEDDTNADDSILNADLVIVVDNTVPALEAVPVIPANKPTFELEFDFDEDIRGIGSDGDIADITELDWDDNVITVTFIVEDYTTYEGQMSFEDRTGNQYEYDMDFTTEFTKSISATNPAASVSMLEDLTTTVSTIITIENTGEVPLKLEASDFTASNLIFQGLENPTTFIVDEESGTYRDGYFVAGSTAVFSLPLAGQALDVDEKVEVTVTYTIPADADVEHYGVYRGIVSIEDTTGEATVTSTASLTLNPITGKSSKFDIDVEYEDDPVYRTQEIEIGVNIDNRHSEKAKSIKVTLMIPELDIEETSSKFTLDDGDDNGEDLKFTFTLEDDVDEGNYPIYIYVIGDSEYSTGTDLTIENYKYADDLEVSVESDDLTVETMTLSEDDYKAGESFVATVKVRNIGTSDQDDVRVRFVCDDLGISELSDITDELKDGKSLTKTFTMKVPTTAKDGSYICTAEILYEDVDDQQDDDDIDSHLTENIVLIVTGGLAQEDPDDVVAKASITGASTTTANIGDVKKFTLNLKNDGTSGSATYTLQMEGYSNWAESAKVEPATLTIPAGTSVPFYAYLTPATGASGAQTATVAAYVGTEKVASQTLTVTVNGGTGIQVDNLGSSITGAVTGFNLDVPTAMIISSIVAGMVILGAVYMVTLGKKI
jgi:hypothetical protein